MKDFCKIFKFGNSQVVVRVCNSNQDRKTHRVKIHTWDDGEVTKSFDFSNNEECWEFYNLIDEDIAMNYLKMMNEPING